MKTALVFPGQGSQVVGMGKDLYENFAAAREVFKKTDEIFAFDDKFIEQAGECGLRSFLILLGALSKINYQPELLSYEGPFGVGYLVMNFVIR